MITEFTVKSFKSLEDVHVDLGQLNVFVGANGSGKSNLLEAIGVLSAAADGKVNDQTLLQRGVRPGVPRLYKSAFPAPRESSHPRKPSHIYFAAASKLAQYDVSLNNPLKDPHPAWRFKTESLKQREEGRLIYEDIASRSPASRVKSNTENGLAALKMVERLETEPSVQLLRTLQDYVIYSPTTPVLRGVAPETQPRQPLGLSGGRLPEAVLELSKLAGKNSELYEEILALIDWAESYSSASSSEMLLSRAASASPRVIRFADRFMDKSGNTLSGYDASEGALYVLFLAVLANHPDTPKLCAIDNGDHGLNPALAKRVIKQFAHWLVESSDERQVLMTCHNPAILDGLPLQDSRIRLFMVDRDNKGKTLVKRLEFDEKLISLAKNDWTLSRLWMSGQIGGMPDV